MLLQLLLTQSIFIFLFFNLFLINIIWIFNIFHVQFSFLLKSIILLFFQFQSGFYSKLYSFLHLFLCFSIQMLTMLFIIFLQVHSFSFSIPPFFIEKSFLIFILINLLFYQFKFSIVIYHYFYHPHFRLTIFLLFQFFN